MKTVIIIFILLIIAAGAVFYFGWIKIEPDFFGLAHSTISGTVNFPLESGNLYWLWQKLIPKTFYLYLIEKEPYTVDTGVAASLPKSESLKDFGNFVLKMKVNVQYKIDFAAAKKLLENGLLTDFKEFYKNEISSLANEMVSAFIIEGMTRYAYSARLFDYKVLDDLKDELVGNVMEYSRLYSLKNVKVSITFSEIPQIDVYVEALKRYSAYMESLYALKEEGILKESEYLKRQMDEDLEFERLRRYGELISQYPHLLKYFYIQKLSERVEVIVLPQDESTGFPRMLNEEELGVKRFLPEETVPEKTVAPSEQEAEWEIQEQPSEEKPGEEEETAVKRKWYEYVKFWELLKKK